MPFASALSEHPVPAHAVGEVAGEVLEKIGPNPDLAMLFLTPPHAGALEDAAAAVRSICHPKTLLGCAAVAVAGVGREVEETPAVSLWAGRFGEVVPARFESVPAGDGAALAGWPGPGTLPFDPQALVLVGDPFSFEVDALFAMISERHPGLPVMGADQETGAIQVNDEVEVGTTVQFQVRDADSADEDLRLLLIDRTADGAMLFTCNGRGRNMFGEPDHDASVVKDLLGPVPLGGIFAA